MKKLFITGLVLFLITGINAGTTGKISGSIVDKLSNEPLIGVNISLEGTVLGSTTDLEGYYVILNIPPGKYTMLIQYLGYNEIRMENVSVSVDLTTKKDFQMVEETMELDETIVVIGERELIQKDLTFSQSTVSAEEMEALPVVSLSDVLQLQPGVTRDAGGGFHIRGGRSSEIAYYVNGISVTDAYDNSQAVEIDNNSIQEFKVISGTFNAEYGNAMSGIINAVTKEGGSKYEGNVQVFSSDYLSNFTSYYYNIDDFNPAENYSFRGSLSGPLPLTNNKITFYTTTRYAYDDGYLYGTRKFNIFGDTLVARDEDTGFFKDGDIVAMNWNRSLTNQSKLTFWPSSTLKLNAELLYSDNNWQNYDHSLKFLPDAATQKFSTSYNGWLAATHTINSTTFYEMNVAYLYKEFNEYRFKDPLDSRYQDPGLLSTIDDLSFRTGGTYNNRFFRSTSTVSFNADLTSQLTRRHLVKAGIEGRLHQMEFDGYSIQDATPTDQTSFTPRVPTPEERTRSKYMREPIEAAAYIQDKIEYDDMIINIGLRLDYLDPNAQVPAIQNDPDISQPITPEYQDKSPEELEALYRKDAKVKTQISPRFAIAYPISEKGVIHFSYGHFLQIPSFEFLYNGSDYRLPENPNNAGIYGNPDLEAQQTIMYEIGLQQELVTDMKIDVTGFYRDVRDWISSSAPIKTVNNGTYIKYINKDYANIKGVTLALQKRYSRNYSFDLSYTFQIAEGSNSSPQQEFNQINANAEPTLTILPLDWDQRHLVNVSVYYGGETWGSSVIARTGSGLPYTPQITQATANRGITTGFLRNSRFRPAQFTVDLRLHKSFAYMNQEFVAFLRVFNLFDTRNIVNVFGDTGQPDFTTGYLGRQQNPESPNSMKEYIRFPWHYSIPRQMQFGLEWSF